MRSLGKDYIVLLVILILGFLWGFVFGINVVPECEPIDDTVYWYSSLNQGEL